MKRRARGSCPIVALASLLMLVASRLMFAVYAGCRGARRRPDGLSNARAAGGYSFRADITQRVVPLASPLNVGRTSRDYQYHIEGKTDLAANQLELSLWDQGGSVLDPSGAAQLKVVDGVASMRRGEQPWQPIDNFSGSFAPDGILWASSRRQRCRAAGRGDPHGIGAHPLYLCDRWPWLCQVRARPAAGPHGPAG